MHEHFTEWFLYTMSNRSWPRLKWLSQIQPINPAEPAVGVQQLQLITVEEIIKKAYPSTAEPEAIRKKHFCRIEQTKVRQDQSTNGREQAKRHSFFDAAINTVAAAARGIWRMRREWILSDTVRKTAARNKYFIQCPTYPVSRVSRLNETPFPSRVRENALRVDFSSSMKQDLYDVAESTR